MGSTLGYLKPQIIGSIHTGLSKEHSFSVVENKFLSHRVEVFIFSKGFTADRVCVWRSLVSGVLLEGCL